jgi:hypothetical protein
MAKIKMLQMMVLAILETQLLAKDNSELADAGGSRRYGLDSGER